MTSTSSYWPKSFYWNSSFELLSRLQFHFELLTPGSSFYFYTFELLTRSWKIKKIHFELLTRWLNVYFDTFKWLTLLKNKKFHLESLIRKLKNKFLIWNHSHSRFPEWNEMIYNSELFEKNKGMLHFVVIVINLTRNRYC